MFFILRFFFILALRKTRRRDNEQEKILSICDAIASKSQKQNKWGNFSNRNAGEECNISAIKRKKRPKRKEKEERGSDKSEEKGMAVQVKTSAPLKQMGKKMLLVKLWPFERLWGGNMVCTERAPIDLLNIYRWNKSIYQSYDLQQMLNDSEN